MLSTPALRARVSYAFAAAMVVLLAYAALASGPSGASGVTPQDGSSLITCDPTSESVSLTLPPGSEDRVAPGWRQEDDAIRLRFVSKGSALVEGDRTCTGARWSRVVIDLNDLSDETTRFGINRQFKPLSDDIRFFVTAGDGDFDEVRGYNGDDSLDGGSGVDELRGYGGRDRLIGGPGEDQLFAGGHADVIEAADGERDQVVCGWGEDTAIVDQFDDYDKDCEHASVMDTPPPDDGEPPSPLAPAVRHIAGKFGVAYLQMDGAGACATMTIDGRRSVVQFAREAFGQFGAGGLPKHCPQVLKFVSFFASGAFGPDLTEADINRAERLRHEHIQRLRSGRGIFGISVAPDGLSATVEEVVGVGSVSAQLVGDSWQISAWTP
jgi:hypothetical protein